MWDICSTIITQFIGFLGLLAFIISYQIKSNRGLYFIQMVGVLLFTLQYALLGAISGCLSLALIAIRNIMLYKYNDLAWIRRKIWPLIFCGLFTLIMALTWAGATSVFAWLASVVATIFYWTNNARKIRAANLFICNPSWIASDILVGSWGGIISEALAMVSIIVSIVRFGWKNMGDSNSRFQQ